MQVAQRLFQGVEIGSGQMEGLITYHRTDSTTLSDKALQESARVIGEMFGAEYHDGPRRYQTRVKNAQEAHEAIRPDRLPARAQPARGRARCRRAQGLRADLEAHDGVADGRRARAADHARDLRARATDGETAVVDRERQGDRVRRLPPRLRRGQRRSRRGARGAGSDPAAVRRSAIASTEDWQRPRSRCSASSRSGTRRRRRPASRKRRSSRSSSGSASAGRRRYAPTIATIVRRGYVFRQGKALVPSFTAFAVTKLLREHFGDFVETDFTAEMEEDLDEISRGEREWVAFLRQFYYGDRKHRGLLPAVERWRREGGLSGARSRHRPGQRRAGPRPHRALRAVRADG